LRRFLSSSMFISIAARKGSKKKKREKIGFTLLSLVTCAGRARKRKKKKKGKGKRVKWLFILYSSALPRNPRRTDDRRKKRNLRKKKKKNKEVQPLPFRPHLARRKMEKKKKEKASGMAVLSSRQNFLPFLHPDHRHPLKEKKKNRKKKK